MLQVVLNFFSDDKSISIAWSKRICLCFVSHFSTFTSDTIFLIDDSLSDLGIVDSFSFLSPSPWVLLVSSSLSAMPQKQLNYLLPQKVPELPEAADDFSCF